MLFRSGQRPAIDSGLSVSRVGGDAQFKATKQVARSLKIELASYLEMKSFSQFGSDLDASTLAILKHGEALMSVLKQKQYNVYQLDKQVFDLYVAKNKYLDNLKKDDVRPTLDKAYDVFKATHQDVLDNINKNKEISTQDEGALAREMKEFFESLNS